jgi:hypothetical protein
MTHFIFAKKRSFIREEEPIQVVPPEAFAYRQGTQ